MIARHRALAVAWLCLPASLLAATVSTSPYDTDPDLRALMDEVTFHHSFDHESLLPDMAAGDWSFTRTDNPRRAPGLRGMALVAGTGRLVFADARNWTITTRGGMALWVSPVKWDHDNAGITTFVISERAAFYIERQGPKRKPDGLWARHERILAGMQRGVRGSKSAVCDSWRPGEWHLLAVNWSWPELLLSVDGQPFQAKVFEHKPDASLFRGFRLGARGGDLTLMDEVFFFRRPLSNPEVRKLYQRLLPPVPPSGEDAK